MASDPIAMSPANGSATPADADPLPRGFLRVAATGATIFLSSFLLFEIQPLICRAILPWFGGTAAVWTASLLFFQCALLAGYFYAHWMGRGESARVKALVHGALLLASLLCLPVIPHAPWKSFDSANPWFRLYGVLGATVGLPYILLSSTSPLLQAWVARDRKMRFPYRLFALSNAGSLLGLLTFPVLVEPKLTGREQALWWSGAYAVFVILCGIEALIIAWRKPAEDAMDAGGSAASTTSPSLQQQMLWAGLAAAASAMLLAVTNHISRNIAAIPLIWVVPLSIYLLSFVLAFAGPRWYPRKTFLLLFALAGCVMAVALFSSEGLGYDGSYRILIGAFAVSLFIWCMVFHGELARRKPAPQHLTRFYLALSVGGAVGGLLIACVAPNIFPAVYEAPLLIAACPVLVLAACRPGGDAGWHKPAWLAGWALTAVVAAYAGYQTWSLASLQRLQVRNFYGALRVLDRDDHPSGTLRQLINGTILHGEEFLAPGRRRIPTSYYGHETGIGRAFQALQPTGPLSVGVVGLGVGTLAAYARPGDHFRFYEINPLVVQIAGSQFYYLSGSPAATTVILGDARLSLERESPQNFDLLAIDAFTSDAIPVHLLTREALLLYARHVKPGGVLALHLSNRHLALEPIAYLGLRSLHMRIMLVFGRPAPEEDAYGAWWMLATDSTSLFSNRAFEFTSEPVEPGPGVRMWTDDYSSIWEAVR